LVVLNVLVAIPGVTVVVAAGMPYILARVLSSGLLVPTNYLVMRHWVFPAAETQQAASAS
jgi:putative flippase GtrA